MPKLSLSLKVSFHRESGQFIKYIGKSYGKDGKLKPKAHYLGSDRGPALKQAAELLSAWYQLLASGAEAWPRDFSFERCGVPLLVSYQSRAAQPIASVPDIEVKEAAKRYIDSIRLRRDAKQVSHYYYLGMEQRVNHAIRYLGGNKLLSEVGEAELTQMMLKIVGRPLVKRINNDPQCPHFSISGSSPCGMDPRMARRLGRTWIDAAPYRLRANAAARITGFQTGFRSQLR